MDWKTFISELIKSFAWPGTILVVVLIFRHEIKSFAGRIKFRMGDSELEFAREVSMMSEKSDDEFAIGGIIGDEEITAKAKELFEIARVDAKAAVMSAFTFLELSARKAAKIHDRKIGELRVVNSGRLMNTLTGKPLMGDHVVQFMKLQKLRNQVAHDEEFELSGRIVQEYIEHCLNIASVLQEYIKKRAQEKRLEPAKVEDESL